MGTFYFVIGDVVEDDDDDDDDVDVSKSIYLTFYNEKERVVHTSKVAALSSTNRSCSSYALSPNAFMILGCLVTLDEAWETSYFHTLNHQVTLELADHISGRTSVHKTGLARIRETAKTDFTLE